MLTAAVPKERRREGHTRLPVPLTSYTSNPKLFTSPVKQIITSTPTTSPRSEPPSFQPLLDHGSSQPEPQRVEQNTFDKSSEDQPPPSDGTRQCQTNETEQPSGVIVQSSEEFGMKEEKKYDKSYLEVLSETEDDRNVVERKRGGGAETRKRDNALELGDNILLPYQLKRPPKAEYVQGEYGRKYFEDRLKNGRTEDEKSSPVFLEAPACSRENPPFRPQPLLRDRVPAFISPSKQLMDCLPPKTDISKSEQMTTKSTKHHHAPKIVELRSLFEVPKTLPRPTLPSDHSSINQNCDIKNDNNNNKNKNNILQVALQETQVSQANHKLAPYLRPTKARQRLVPTLDELRSMTQGLELLAEEGCDPETRANILKGVMLMFHDGPRPRPWNNAKSDPIHMLRQITPERSMTLHNTSCSEHKSDIEQYLCGSNVDDDDDDGDQVMLEAVHVEDQSIAESAFADVGSTHRSIQQWGPPRDAAEHSWNEVDGAMLREIMSSDGSVADECDISVNREVVNVMAVALGGLGKVLKNVGRNMDTRQSAKRKKDPPTDALDNIEKTSVGVEDVRQNGKILVSPAERGHVLKSTHLEISNSEFGCEERTGPDSNDNATVELKAECVHDLKSAHPEISDSISASVEGTGPDCNNNATSSELEAECVHVSILGSISGSVEKTGLDCTDNATPSELPTECVHVSNTPSPSISDPEPGFGKKIGPDCEDNAISSQLVRIPSTCHRSTMIDRHYLPLTDLKVHGSTSNLRRSYLVPAILFFFAFLAPVLLSSVCSTYTVLDACFSTKMIDRREILGIPVEVEKFLRWESRPGICREIGGSQELATVLTNFLEIFTTCEARDREDGMDLS